MSHLFLANIVASGLSFATGILVAARLGASDYGVYAAVLAIFTFCSVPADFGWFASGARRLAEVAEDGTGRVVAALSLVWVLACALVAVAAVSLGLSGFFPDSIRNAAVAAAAVAGGALTGYLTDQVLKGLGRPSLLAAANVVTRVGVLLAVVAVTWEPASPTKVLVVTLSVQVAAAAVVLLRVGALQRGAVEELRGPLARTHRSFGRGLSLGRTASLLAVRSDALVLAATHAPKQVGFYLLAQSVMSPVVLLAQARATRAFRGSIGSTLPERVLRRTFLEACALCVPAGAIGIAVSRLDGYGGVLPLLPLCAVAVALQACYQPFNGWLLANAAGAPFRTMLLTTAAANLAANVALIPWLGAVGAAAASCVGNGCYLLLARRLYVRRASDPAPTDRGDL